MLVAKLSRFFKIVISKSFILVMSLINAATV